MAKKKGAEVVEPAAAETTGRSKRLLIVAGLVVALGMLGGGAMASGLVGGGSSDVGEPGATAAPAPTPTAEELGMLVQLDSITLNLAAGRFLKLGVAVELAPGVVEEPPTAPVYDEVIELFGPMTFEQLSDAGIRNQTKTTLLAALADVYGTDIVGIYYTEFVMQ